MGKDCLRVGAKLQHRHLPREGLAPHLLIQFGETWAVSSAPGGFSFSPPSFAGNLSLQSSICGPQTVPHIARCRCPRLGRRRGLDSTATQCSTARLRGGRLCGWSRALCVRMSRKQILCHSQVCTGPEPLVTAAPQLHVIHPRSPYGPPA